MDGVNKILVNAKLLNLAFTEIDIQNCKCLGEKIWKLGEKTGRNAYALNM